MAAAFPLTPEQITSFEAAGMLRIPNYFSRDLMAEMADKLWADLRRRFGIERHQPETWTTERPAQFQALIGSGAFDALAPRLASIAETFFGSGGWERPRHLGQPLVTFPTGTWEVPHSMWHIDLPLAESVRALPIIRGFVLLEPVAAKGGGTCYVEGSHRVIHNLANESRKPLRSQEVKALLEDSEPWFAALFSSRDKDREKRFMRDGSTIRGVETRVRETVGESGDLYVMHPAMLHTVSPNTLTRPRIMLVQPMERRR